LQMPKKYLLALPKSSKMNCEPCKKLSASTGCFLLVSRVMTGGRFACCGTELLANWIAGCVCGLIGGRSNDHWERRFDPPPVMAVFNLLYVTNGRRREGWIRSVSGIMRSVSYRFNVANVPKIAIVAR